MPGSFRKVPGVPSELGSYQITGSLAGISPGTRVIRTLVVGKLTSESPEGLSPLRTLNQLQGLVLDQLDGVDLAPLEGMALTSLSIDESRGLDLAPINEVHGLSSLHLVDLDACWASSALALPAVEELTIVNDRAGLTGDTVRVLINAIDWRTLTKLRRLTMAVGGSEVLKPIAVDLGFLRELPALERLDLFNGIWHDDRGPNPLEPPFNGLSRTLQEIRIDASDAEATTCALEAYLSQPVVVYQREGVRPQAPWELVPPGQFADRWSAYGSFADVFETESELEGLAQARTTLESNDPDLVKRLEFDPESEGTSMIAADRHDVEAALRALGLGAGGGRC